MCTDDAIEFINRVKPEITVFIHLGIVILKHDADAQAKKAQEITGCTVMAGRDLMRIRIGESIEVEELTPCKPEWNDAWDLPES
jgi:hypothetical protein